ncbi:MAG: Hint domain-containing protein [Marinibacterium sp.]|nr:Hint domain-containing protein [Marinibacterium sp.]
MTISNIELYGNGFTVLNTETRNGSTTGDIFLYDLDFQGGAVSEVTITGNFGSASDPNDAYLTGFIPPSIGNITALGNGAFSYTVSFAEAVAYVDSVGSNFVTSVAEGRVFGDGSLISDYDTLVGQIVNLCFGEGTMIATPEGEKAVETLEMGDLVRTADGKDVAVKWIGRQTVSTVFGGSERRSPVRIAAGALGDNLPANDLVVTADHAIMLDGVLCHAGALVNGATIKRVPLSEMGPETFMVYHIETEAHELVLAEGVEAETLIDNATRATFDNFDEYVAAYGDTAEMEELPFPRAMSARQLPAAIRARLSIDVAA